MVERPVLILSFTDHARDPRVNRQLRFLGERYRLVAAGTGDAGLPGVRFVALHAAAKGLGGRLVGASRLAARRYESYYWNTAAVRDALFRLREVHAALIVANDLETLPLALRLAAGAPVLFDAHEYAPLEFEDQLSFRLLHRPFREHLVRRYVPQVAAMTTVCERIAEEYERDSGVRPRVVWNAPDATLLDPAPVAADGPLRLVHHGGAQRSRRLELMLQAMRALDDRFELHLVLMGNDRDYLRELRREAADDPRIRFHDPVPMLELPRFLNRFDVGVFLLPPVNFNYRFALPNKLFEFVQARLAVAIGPSPEMARLVERHALGVIAEDFSPQAFARRLRSLDAPSVAQFKRNADAAAAELSSAPGRRTWLELAALALARGAA